LSVIGAEYWKECVIGMLGHDAKRILKIGTFVLIRMYLDHGVGRRGVLGSDA
jgi:hypothetical protein